MDIRLITTAICLCFAFISCSGDEESVLKTASLPLLELNYDFSITETEDLFFQRIDYLKTDSKGQIFITDTGQHSIFVFSDQGEYLHSIGGEGRGPGEFQSMRNLYIDQKDRVFVFDIRSAQTTIFSSATSAWEVDTIVSTEGTFYGIISADEQDNLVLRQSPFQQPTPGVYWYKHDLAKGHISKGITEPEVMSYKDMAFIVLPDSWMMNLPFAPITLIETSPHGYIYLIWSESLTIRKYNIQLDLIDSLSVSLPNQEVTNEERNATINNFQEHFRSAARQHLPDTKPVVSKFWVDRDENFWLKTYDSPEYMVLDKNGEPLGSFDLDENHTILHVDGNRLYTRTESDTGLEIAVFNVSFH